MQNYVQIHSIESELELPQEFWKKRNSSAPYKDICTQISFLLLVICILYMNFCPISSTRNRDQRILKITEKRGTTAPPVK